MGVLTDFVVADEAEAERVGKSTCPSQEFHGMVAKGIDTMKLGRLHAAITGMPFQPSFMANALAFEASEDGPWVFRVPTELVNALALLGPDDIARIGTDWAKAEEFSPKYDNWPAAAVKDALNAIAVLCAQATAGGKALFMWMCL